MATSAAHGRTGKARDWWSRYWSAVLGREHWIAATDELDTSVSFAEVVWAHFQRQEQVYAGTMDGGVWEEEYRRRLKRFKQEHGDIRKDYWCRYQASGVALKVSPDDFRERHRGVQLVGLRDPVLAAQDRAPVTGPPAACLAGATVCSGRGHP